jgi:deoxyribonuclease IV
MSQSNNVLVGSHVSSAGGYYKAIERGQSIGATAIQIFSKSNRQWFEKPITEHEAEQFKQTWKASTVQEVVVHAGYLINIGSAKQDTATMATNALIQEIERCHALGIKYLVLHPGSHVGAGVEVCLTQIANNLDRAFEKSSGTVTILLETMAGQGTNVGRSFEELASIRHQVTAKKNLGFCFDTCHVFCAGYDITTPTGFSSTLDDFDKILGLSHLKAIHVNDSQTPIGSNKDRHAPLGEGHIPLAAFDYMMNESRLAQIPKLLETPSDPEMQLWAKEIAMLKAMIR